MSQEFNATITKRVILEDADGQPWDMANPNLVAVKQNLPNTTASLVFIGGEIHVSIDYATAKAAFEAT